MPKTKEFIHEDWLACSSLKELEEGLVANISSGMNAGLRKDIHQILIRAAQIGVEKAREATIR